MSRIVKSLVVFCSVVFGSACANRPEVRTFVEAEVFDSFDPGIYYLNACAAGSAAGRLVTLGRNGAITTEHFCSSPEKTIAINQTRRGAFGFLHVDSNDNARFCFSIVPAADTEDGFSWVGWTVNDCYLAPMASSRHQ